MEQPNPIKQMIVEAHREWVAVRGDKTLRLDYDLRRESVVLDVGGFEGQWASDIFGMHLCDVHIFEPVNAYCESIKRRFRANDRIHVFPFGLGGSDRNEKITIAGDASTFVGERNGEAQSIDIVAGADFLDKHFPGRVDLMKINIEGAEYELLEHLIVRGTVKRIDNIQVQFHDFVPDAVNRMKKIHAALQLTHTLTYQYPFIWENWRVARQP
ncbi:MAG: FkbM family methyltransferase [Burkholderiales bacterium]